MTPELDPVQRLLLWRLAVAEGDGMYLKELESPVGPARRTVLVRAGLIAEELRPSPASGRDATFLRLEDGGWGWCQSHLGEAIGSRSQLSGPILERLLALLARYFRSRRLAARERGATSFGEFIRLTQDGHDSSAERNGRTSGRNWDTADTARADLAAAVRHACWHAAGGRGGVGVRLAELRGRLRGVPPAGVDESLLALERDGEVALAALPETHDLTPADRAAALRTAAGGERHVLYLVEPRVA